MFFTGIVVVIVIIAIIIGYTKNENSNEFEEKQEREKQEREKQEREKQEREKQEREKQEREKQEHEKQEHEKQEHEKQEHEKRVREKQEFEKQEFELSEISKLKKKSNFIYIKTMGFLLLVGSLFFLYSLIFGFKQLPISHIIVWMLYLFTQFFGLYLLGFGTITGLHSLIVMGKYMSTIFIIITIIIIFSIFNVIEVSMTFDIVLLTAINAFGIITIIYVEKKLLKQEFRG